MPLQTERISYRQLCHLGPEILVTLKDKRETMGPDWETLQENMETCLVEVAVKYFFCFNSLYLSTFKNLLKIQ